MAALLAWLPCAAGEIGKTNPVDGPVVDVRVEHAAGYDYFSSVRTGAVRTAKPRGGYLMMGGGDHIDAAFRWLIDHAGGGHIVVLRASGDDNLHGYLLESLGGVASVETIVLHDREASDDARVLAVIRHADGLFIAGGDQANYLRHWRSTPVAAAIDAHVRAGKPIGGTSAGLAIQGGFSFSALKDTVTSDEALADPFDPRITLSDDFLHWPMLGAVITDSHFSQRHRLGRLIAFLARLRDASAAPLTGIGVDENTALCVEADGSARVFSGHVGGQVWLVGLTEPARTLRPGSALSVDGVELTALDESSTFNLRTRVIERPASRAIARIDAGRLTVEVVH